jgi:hypothetical protein
MLGKNRHAVERCDEGDGTHTWDIVRHGRVVAQGIRTRAEARAEAKRLDEQERAEKHASRAAPYLE